MSASATPRLDQARAELLAKTPRCRAMSAARAQASAEGMLAREERVASSDRALAPNMK